MSSATIPSPDYERLAAPRAVDLQHVEAELMKLRLEAPCTVPEIGGHAHDQQPITRACMSNLMVYCETPADADALTSEFALMARRHPARIVLLVGENPDQSQEIVAEISAGLTNVGKRRQISSEQIRLSASPAGRARLASAARPFLIGDLPTALWWNCTTPPPNGGDLFHELDRMATSLVYDSRGWSDPRAGMLATASWALDASKPTLITDLAWMRSRVWRRLFGEALAPHVLPGALAHIESIELRHGPHALPLVWLFVGWLAHCLDWKPVGGKFSSDKTVKMHFQSANRPLVIDITRDDHGPSELHVAKVSSRGAGVGASKIEVEFEALDAERVAIRVDNPGVNTGCPRTENFVSAPDEPVVLMLAWQLANRSGQPEFRNALNIARLLAKEFPS